MGNALNCCGVTDTLGFARTTASVIRLQGIEPWPARELVKDNLARQAALARRHPLNKVPVDVGMNWFKDDVGGWFQHSKLTRDKFVDRATDLLVRTNTKHTQLDRNALYDVFDSMDYDGNGELSVGEWAGGLTVFFKGNVDECIHAVFDVIDVNGDKSLSRSELREYLKPFVNAMTPPEAADLRPLLQKKAADDIFEEMDFDHNQQISSDEMLEWTKKGNNIIDRLAKVIDHEVYSIWIDNKERQRQYGYGHGGVGAPPPEAPQSRRQRPGEYDGYAPYGRGNPQQSPYGGSYAQAPGGNYGEPPQYGGNYGGNYSMPPQNGRQEYGFMTDYHQNSAFGGAY